MVDRWSKRGVAEGCGNDGRNYLGWRRVLASGTNEEDGLVTISVSDGARAGQIGAMNGWGGCWNSVRRVKKRAKAEAKGMNG